MISISCLICKATLEPQIVDQLSIIKCPQCGNFSTYPRPSFAPESAEIWEDTYGGQRLLRRNNWRIEAGMRLNFVHLYQPGGSMLEVGCGTGEFLEIAQQQGHEVYGIEPSSFACKHARDLDVFVINSQLSQAMNRLRNFKFDSISLWHTLEHLNNPVETLKLCSELIANDGFLFIEVPNYLSLDSKRLGLDWSCLEPTQHYHHFTKDGLNWLLDLVGFKPLSIIEFTQRMYWDINSWKQITNQRLLEGINEHSKDYLRVVASKIT